jgi:hypothetical protein
MAFLGGQLPGSILMHGISGALPLFARDSDAWRQPQFTGERQRRIDAAASNNYNEARNLIAIDPAPSFIDQKQLEIAGCHR